MKKSLSKKLAISLVIAMVLTFSLVSNVFASYWGGTRTLKTINSHRWVAVYPLSTISDNSYINLHNNYGNAMEYWTGISSQMYGIHGLSSRETNCDLATAIFGSVAGLYGYIQPCDSSGSQVPTDSNWAYCIMRYYANQLATLADLQRTMVIAHEMGHAQKLSHCDANGTVPVPSIMKTDTFDDATYVTDYDKQEIRSKWGN